MKFFLTVLSITGWLFFATAQQETARDVPRLLQQYASATTDTARIILQCRIAEAYRASKPDTSMTLAMDALFKSKAIKFKKGEIHSLIVQCVLYREKGDLPEALEQGLKALPIAEEEKLGYEQIYAAIRIANVYIAVRDYSKAITYLQKSEELLKKDFDEFQWAVTHYFYAVIYEQNNDLNAVEKKIRLLEERHGSERTWIILLNRLRGHVAVKRKELPAAIKYYHESNAAAVAEEGFREVSTTSNAIAKVFRDLGEKDSAIAYAKEALKYGEMLNYKNRILEASKLLATLYTDSDPAEAAKYYKMTLAANDSLYSVQKVLQLQSATMQEQERKAEQEAARIAYQNRIKQWTMMGGIAAVLIIALILYRNNRQKQKTNQVLEKTLTDLKTTQSQLIQSEKMASLGELTAGIAHEIQNPLNFVNNFSEVNTELVDELKSELR
jgi:two-component system, NtrC family, sensor kinase